MIALAVVAFVVGAIVGSQRGLSPQMSVAEQFVRAWAGKDYATMYDAIDRSSLRALTASALAADYQAAARMATTTRMALAAAPRQEADGTVVVPVRVSTRLFGTLAESFRLRISTGEQGARVVWSRALLFPGLHAGETLTRQTALPPRAALLARDGSVLADGEALGAGVRNSPLGAAASAVVGEVGPVPAASAAQLQAEGVPAEAIVGVSGLEAAFDRRLRGEPGGELLAGGRVLASAAAKPGRAVRTSISPVVQQAAAVALGGQYGGIVALDPTSGEVLAVAGIGLDGLQPPGSTFKIVTVTGALQAGLARAGTVFPYETSATLDGVKLENANGESCGGSLELAFAVSCNSVFSPLGVKLGAPRLVATAERFGFNHDPGLAGAAESTIPPASQVQGELALGSTAIGQGEVQASALQMATVAAAIADEGVRPTATFTRGGRPQDASRRGAASHARGTRVTSAAVARIVRQMMIAVVGEGTGTAAAVPGVVVAGKTGTAELGTPRCPGSEGEGANGGSGSGGKAQGESSSSEEAESEAGSAGCSKSAKDPHNTDAWFAAFAPALHPRIAVGVLLVRDGFGGETAAPVARQVLEAGLRQGA